MRIVQHYANKLNENIHTYDTKNICKRTHKIEMKKLNGNSQKVRETKLQ